MPDGDEDAPALIKALAARGVGAESAVWDDPHLDWGRFDLVVVRSTWDYVDRRDEFLAWAESVPRLLNAPDVLRWNTDKRYLAMLGIGVVPTIFLEAGEAFRAPTFPFVIKPSVGAGSIGAARYEAGDAGAQTHVDELHAAGKTVMVQPYVEAVDQHGETALLYSGGSGAFSHAVRKAPLLPLGEAPAADGLYVEGQMTPTEPTADELELGERTLAAVPFPRAELLYARVDLLPGPVVLEVELTEPSLFLGYAEGAVERFAAAIAAASQRRRMSAENGPTTSQ